MNNTKQSFKFIVALFFINRPYNKKFYVSRADGSSHWTLVFQRCFCTWLDRTLFSNTIRL